MLLKHLVILADGAGNVRDLLLSFRSHDDFKFDTVQKLRCERFHLMLDTVTAAGNFLSLLPQKEQATRSYTILQRDDEGLVSKVKYFVKPDRLRNTPPSKIEAIGRFWLELKISHIY